MLHYYKFRQELLDPAPGREVYVKRPAGKGWPEHCPPIRAANAFGFDLLANFDVTFVKNRGQWKVAKDIVIESDFEWAARADAEGSPLQQRYAWFWERGQKLPHTISDNVYRQIKNQVKISSYLFLASDADELMLFTDVPNMKRSWRSMTALVESDWYPASYPWHTVIELDDSQKRITIKRGEPLCRVIPLQRATYVAEQMSQAGFDEFFERGQKWLAKHGKFEHETAHQHRAADITGTYVRQQRRCKFVVK